MTDKDLLIRMLANVTTAQQCLLHRTAGFHSDHWIGVVSLWDEVLALQHERKEANTAEHVVRILEGSDETTQKCLVIGCTEPRAPYQHNCYYHGP